jgi:hypothetical protein
MIIPIRNILFNQFTMPSIDDEILLIKERDNGIDDIVIGAYNKAKQKIGTVSIRSIFNRQVYSKLIDNYFYGKVFCISKNNILVEIDFPKNSPSNKDFLNN